MNNLKPITESVLLRALTGKSILWFGKYKDLSVQQIIDMNNQEYLRWIYYNCRGITYTDDILNIITITEERRIIKPGIAPEMHDKVCEENEKKMSFYNKSHYMRVARIRAKCKLMSTYMSVFPKKSRMQAINQGKYY